MPVEGLDQEVDEMMNATRIPGFTAEASLDRGEARYRAVGSLTGLEHGADSVLPALPMECLCSDDGCCCWTSTIFCCWRAGFPPFCTRM